MANKILVIDDDLESLKLIGLLLQRQGYEVVAAPAGIDGLAMARNESPDLILLDIMMPEMDGYEVCRQLRADAQLAHIPVIMFTAKTRVDDKVAGFEAGADDYLTKPTHPAELASRIRGLLARSATVRSVVIEHAQGKVIAVLGVKGGSGCTTLAVNLGAAMSKEGKSLALADLHHGAGAIGLQLGYEQEDGLDRLLELPLQTLGEEQVQRSLVEDPSGIKLLLSAYNPTMAGTTPSVMHIERIVALLPALNDITILDLGNGIGDASIQALKQADQILLCLPPQRSVVKMTVQLFEHIKQSGIRTDRIGVVLVDTSLVPPSDLAPFVEQLGLPMLGYIESAPALALSAFDHERPMTLLEPESTTANQFRELGQAILARLEREASQPA
jgi:pilus assembly protein CpaE